MYKSKRVATELIGVCIDLPMFLALPKSSNVVGGSTVSKRGLKKRKRESLTLTLRESMCSTLSLFSLCKQALEFLSV